jgi:hypothetical protein
VKHYFGCIEIAERDKFLDAENEVWTYERGLEAQALRLLPENACDSDETIKEKARHLVQKKIENVAVSIEAQYRRTEVLLNALRKPSSSGQPSEPTSCHVPSKPTSLPAHGDLVGYVEQSRLKWRRSKRYKKGIDMVRGWKRREAIPDNYEEESDSTAADDNHLEERYNAELELGDQTAEREREQVRRIAHQRRERNPNSDDVGYDLEHDVNAYVIQYTRQVRAADSGTKPGDIPPLGTVLTHSPKILPATASASTQVAEMSRTSTGTVSQSSIQETSLRPVDEELRNTRFKGRFPGQRISIHDLLRWPSELEGSRDEINILSKSKCAEKDPTRIRYVHIPYNNMEVSLLP